MDTQHLHTNGSFALCFVTPYRWAETLYDLEVYPSHNQMILLQLPILTQYLHADGPGILCFTAPRHHAILYDLKPHPYHYEHHSLVTPIGCHADVKCKMYKTAMSITLCPHSFKRFGSWEQQTS